MVKPKKQLGQNFLNSGKIAEKIASFAPADTEKILEVGPGKGILTKSLLEKGFSVIAVEKDNELIPFLEDKFQSEIKSGKLKLVNKDALEFSLSGNYSIVSNIPYYITGALIKHFLEAKNQPSSIVLLVQKEVAERIVEKDGKSSILSISVKIYGNPKIVLKVPARFFTPKPKVDSAVIQITNIKNPFKNEKEKTRFFKLLKTGFSHKRKKLISNLKSFAPEEKLQKTFQSLGVLNARAEELSKEKWWELFRTL